MADKDLRLASQKIKGHEDEAWWYEEPNGMSVICEFKDDDGTHLQTKVMLIPWHFIRGALGRKDA